ncbi:tudor/PWWP/MBT superfamily protein isoform X2 [Tasmannia lanceolata]|uniref:tudor/PWWP/MBT superfamily protein isoform X2 n=1 Tax=Tasmannia lanceolata TaxID=3420 RepID=UPI004064584E
MSSNLSPTGEAAASHGLNLNLDFSIHETTEVRVSEQSASETLTEPSFSNENSRVFERREDLIETLFHDSDVPEEDPKDHVLEEADRLEDEKIGVLNPRDGIEEGKEDLSFSEKSQNLEIRAENNGVVGLDLSVGDESLSGRDHNGGDVVAREIQASLSDLNQDIAEESNTIADSKQSVGLQSVDENPDEGEVVMVGTVSNISELFEDQPVITDSDRVKESVGLQPVDENPDEGDVVMVDSSSVVVGTVSNASESSQAHPVISNSDCVKESVGLQTVDENTNGGDVVMVDSSPVVVGTVSNTSESSRDQPDSDSVKDSVGMLPDKIADNEAQVVEHHVMESVGQLQGETPDNKAHVVEHLEPLQDEGENTVAHVARSVSLLPDMIRDIKTLVVELQAPPQYEGQSTGAHVPDSGSFQGQEDQMMGTQVEICVSENGRLQNGDCNFPDETQTFGGDGMGSDVSVPQNPDEKQDPSEVGVSLFSENQLVGSRVVDLDASRNADESLNSGVEVTEAQVSPPDECDNKEVEIKEVGAEGKFSTSDENVATDITEEDAAETEMMDVLEPIADIGAQELPEIAQTKTVKRLISSHGKASIKKEHRASYHLPQEKEGEFSVSDLVWGKVRSHPWWPGQIFDPSDSSELAVKYKRKGSFLVAYFGDQTFAWCDASQLKPFLTNFPQMEKQSNSDGFLNAVDCAVDEVSRRVEFGLACSCLPEEACFSIKCQEIDNAGIKEGATSAGGVGRSTSVTSFEPNRLVAYVKALALSPPEGGDRLDLLIAKAQLMAFYRLKGYPKLPIFHIYGPGLLETDADPSPSITNASNDIVEHGTIISKDEALVPVDLVLGKRKSKRRESSSLKRAQFSEDGLDHTRKKRSLVELMTGKKGSTIVNSGSKSVDANAAQKSVSHSAGKKRKAIDSFSADSVQSKNKKRSSLNNDDTESPIPKKSFKVGDCIRKVASQLTGSSPILKFSSERFQRNAAKVDQSRGKAIVDVSPRTPVETRKRRAANPMDYSSPEEILSQLCLAARDPMKGYSFLSMIVSVFTGFRNSICRSRSNSARPKKLMEEFEIKTDSDESPNSAKSDSDEMFQFSDMKDSYWTDRTVQCDPEEQPLCNKGKRKGEPQLQSPTKKPKSSKKPSKSIQSSPKQESK